MRTSLVLSALLSATTVFALPTVFERSEICEKSPADGRGCTLFKQQDFKGETEPSDYTPVPADGTCMDLDNIYGAWAGEARSLVVNKGFKCDFYTEASCPSDGTPLCLGDNKKQTLKKKLPASYDKKISSVKCKKL